MRYLMRRREFITFLAGATAAWPLPARAQQRKVPVVGFLHAGVPEAHATTVAAFRKGLSETGYVEGRNVVIEFRWAYNDFIRLPELAAELVRLRVAVIATPAGTAAPLAAKGATTTVPIVFSSAGDAVQTGLVASLNRPGGNVTGVSSMSGELGAKRLGLLHELLPRATHFGALVNLGGGAAGSLTSAMIGDLQAAAPAIGSQIEVLGVVTNRDIDTVFASLAQKRIDALLVTTNVLFTARRVQIVTLASRHEVPVMYSEREAVDIGGLMSYASSGADRDRLTGVYVGRVLKGEKPAEMPVMRATKFELVINLQTARTLGIEVPPTLLALADEAIE
jgi:putative tryptophan/tyrosine transport system substrate-binding protein